MKMKHSVMKKMAAALGVFSLLCVTATVASAYSSTWTKSQCQDYSAHGLHERYVFGGDHGWNDNDVWGDPSTEGEDCSGYVARCYALPGWTAEGANADPYHPYDTLAMYQGINHTLQRVGPNWTEKWDFFVYRSGFGASGNHTGLIKTWNASDPGASTSFTTHEAQCTDCGIVQTTRTKTFLQGQNSRYYRRDNW